MKTGFNENDLTNQKRSTSANWNKAKVFGCPVRVKNMYDTEQILSELAISCDKIVISEYDMTFLSTPTDFKFKQEHFRSAKCPADLLFN